MSKKEQHLDATSIILEVIESPLVWILIGTAILIWRLSKWHSDLNHRMGDTETKIEGVQTKLGSLETLTGNLSNRLDKINDDIKEIYKLIVGNPLEKVTSPISLTEYGKSLSERLEALKIVDLKLTQVTRSVEGMNAYQIQEYCFSFSKEQLLDELQKKNPELAQKIYEVAFDEGMEIEKLTRVIALEMRDRILSDLNKSHEEIDEHSPES